MSRPLDFAARLLAQRGALVEATPGSVEAPVSASLASELGVGEHVVLVESPGPAAEHVGYGSALLERMVTSATGIIPFVAARANVAPARGSQARAAVEEFGAAVVRSLEEMAVAPPEPATLVTGARAALAACAAQAAEAAAGFREGMERRFARDRERLEGYFADLVSELDSRLARGRVSAADVEDKRRVLERERAAKIEALSARYATRLELRAVAAMLVEAPVFRIALELRRRKASRSIEVEYDCATRRLVTPPCDACGSPAPRPAACDDAVHLLCEVCAPRSEGRVACVACQGRRERRPRTQAAGVPANGGGKPRSAVVRPAGGDRGCSSRSAGSRAPRRRVARRATRLRARCSGMSRHGAGNGAC